MVVSLGGGDEERSLCLLCLRVLLSFDDDEDEEVGINVASWRSMGSRVASSCALVNAFSASMIAFLRVGCAESMIGRPAQVSW